MTETTDLLALLGAPGTSLSKTLVAVQTLERTLPLQRHYRIGLSSNVNMALLSTYLRKHGLLQQTRVEVLTGGHDDPVGDLERFADADVHTMLWLPFFDNLMPAFEQQIPHLSAAQIDAKEADLRARCRLVFDRAQRLRQLHVGSLHRLGQAAEAGAADLVAEVLLRFNTALREEAAAFAHVRLIDTETVVRQIGAASSFDLRFYLRSSTPYTAAFCDELARRVALATRGFDSHFYKALVLDCDNTLWGGVIGEDTLAGIQLDPHSYPGKVFWRAQMELLSLERSGVLLCLCSKNNPADVDEVFDKHPHAVIRPAHITLARVNWQDKVGNLRAIAEALNIGLDSLVFVDDSDFECEAVRQALPMVRVVQVPRQLSDYPRVLQCIRELFLAGGVAPESREKTAQYRQRLAASASSADHDSHEAYLASLTLSVQIDVDDIASVERISELTMKSNQFNLTTLRQTPAQIRQRMQDANGSVLSLTVRDRFGDAGLTGVVLTQRQGEVLEIEAFLMSCRVIGRGVEQAVWPVLADLARQQGCSVIEATYRPSAKNAQVAGFYDDVGLSPAGNDEGTRRYRTALDTFHPKHIDWIEVKQCTTMTP